MTLFRSLHNIVIFSTCSVICSGFITSHHFLARYKITPVGRNIMVNPVNTLLSLGKDNNDGHEDEDEDGHDEQQYETLSSLSAKLNDLAMIQIEEFEQQKQQQQQSSNNNNDDDKNDDDKKKNIEGEESLFAISTEEELVRLDILHTRLKGIPLNRTFVGPSPVAGRGLFAACDCLEGDLLTCFPGDAMVLLPDDDDEDDEDDEDEDTGTEQEWTVLWGDHVQTTKDGDRDYVTEDWFLGNLIHAHGENVGIVGVPSLDRDPAYLGHFANDGAPTELIPTCEADCDTYVLASNLAANAINEDIAKESHMVTVATRDIKKGEEIFVTYGPDYWLEQQVQRQWKPPVMVDEEMIIGTMSTDKDVDVNKQTRRKPKSSPSSSGKGFA